MYMYMYIHNIYYVLSMHYHDPCHDSYHKIHQIFILEKYHPIVSSNIHDENLESEEHSFDLSYTRFPCVLWLKITFKKNHLVP